MAELKYKQMFTFQKFYTFTLLYSYHFIVKGCVTYENITLHFLAICASSFYLQCAKKSLIKKGELKTFFIDLRPPKGGCWNPL